MWMIAAAKFMINLFNFGMKFSYKYTGVEPFPTDKK